MENIWGKYARAYDVLNRLGPYQKAIDHAAIKLVTQPGTQILDMCCGTGNLAQAISKLWIPEGVKLVCCDNSQAMLQRTSKKIPHAEVDIIDGNDRLPYSDNQFGAVGCLNALYTLKNPAAVLAELYRITQPGGLLYISNPIHDHNQGWILAEHVGDSGNLAYWEKVSHSLADANQLTQKAVPDQATWEAFSTVLSANIAIYQETSCIFTDTTELLSMVHESGFTIHESGLTYAGVSAYVFAEKQGV